MEVKYYNKLIDDSINIRQIVFVQEQGFIDEFDEIDNSSIHAVVYDGLLPIATARFYTLKDNIYYIGRIAVIKEYRGKKIGSYLLKEIEKEIIKLNGKEIKVHSQLQAKPFYLSLGFKDTFINDFDQDCPHVWLKKEL